MHIQFGSRVPAIRPPKLFSRMTEEELERFDYGEKWKPETPVGSEHNHNSDDIDHILSTPRGIIPAMPQVGPIEIIRRLGFRKAMESAGLLRFVKEAVKYAVRDPLQDYTPHALGGFWVHRHDLLHIDIRGRLAPIPMGEYKVTGVNGISAKIAPHFHPDEPHHKGNKEEGMMDEYRTAIHAWVTNKCFANGLRLLYYQARFIRQVPHPFNAIKDHRHTIRRFHLDCIHRIPPGRDITEEEFISARKKPLKLRIYSQHGKRVTKI